MTKYRLDFKEPSWDWDDAAPCQYYHSREDAEKDMHRGIEVDGQRFRCFRIYEQKTPGDWILVEEFSFERPNNSK